jgi:cell division protein FtsI (penicillin-binding protein 3)
LALVGTGFAVLFCTIAWRTVDVSVFARTEPARAGTTTTDAAPMRGDIVDRNGWLLARTVECPTLNANPSKVFDPAATADAILSVLPDLDHGTLLTRLSTDRRHITLARQMSPQAQQRIHDLGLPAIGFETEHCRLYPQGSLAAHIVGFTDRDGAGLSGLERSQHETLSAGKDLLLALDARVQDIITQALAASVQEFQAIGGTAMVLDAHTSEVLGLVTLPDFDPNQPIQSDDPRMFNMATKAKVELGSVFKVFNTALALESGKVRLSDTFETIDPVRYGRHRIRDFHPADYDMNVPAILRESSNIGSIRMMQRVGRNAQRRFLTALGLTQPLRIELPERADVGPPGQWGEVESYTITFGHGIAVSPMHVASAMTAMVNGGALRRPTLLRQDDLASTPVRQVISARTSDLMRRLLRSVVTGGAGLAEADGYLVGGKTGTAEKPRNGGYASNARLSSFVGAFPMHDPVAVVMVVMDEPKPTARTYGHATGGWTAAPTVGRIVARIAPLLGVMPADETDPAVDDRLRLPVLPNDPKHVAVADPRPIFLPPRPARPSFETEAILAAY